MRTPWGGASQSPENGSRLCKRKNPLCSSRKALIAGRNPLRTGLGSARLGAEIDTGAGGICQSQSPENGSRLCKEAGCPRRLIACRTHECRNPLRTGLGSASPPDRKASDRIRDHRSQSPENGSRLCKRPWRAAWGFWSGRCRRNPLRTGLGSARTADQFALLIIDWLDVAIP